MNCPKCNNPVSFTDKYCNSCGEIVNKLIIQQSENKMTTEAEIDVLLTSEQKTYVPKGPYAIKKENSRTYNFVNEQDETINTFQQHSVYTVDKTLYTVFYIILLFFGVAFLYLLVQPNLIEAFPNLANIIDKIVIPTFVIVQSVLMSFLLFYVLYKIYKEKEIGIFLDKKGKIIGILSRKSLKYYVKTTNGIFLLLIETESLKSKLTIYTMEYIYWSQEQEKFIEGHHVKNGTYCLTNGEVEIALLLKLLEPAEDVEDSFLRINYPKHFGMDVYKDNYESLLLLTWGLILINRNNTFF